MPQEPIKPGDPSSDVDPYGQGFESRYDANGNLIGGYNADGTSKTPGVTRHDYDGYAGKMLGAYGDQLKYAQSLQGQPSAAAQQVRADARMGGQQGTSIMAAQAGSMGANPAMAREASYGGTQMRGQMRAQGNQDANVLQMQQNAANQQLMQQTLQQRAMYEQMMRDDATRRYGGILGLQGQKYGADTNSYLSGLEGDAAERDMYIKLGGSLSGMGGAGGAGMGGAFSDRRLKRGMY